MTVDQIIDFMQRVIAEDRLSGNRAGLKNTQIAAGFLMAAGNYAGDKVAASDSVCWPPRPPTRKKSWTGKPDADSISERRVVAMTVTWPTSKLLVGCSAT